MINSVSLFIGIWRDNADMSNVKRKKKLDREVFEVLNFLAEYERVIS